MLDSSATAPAASITSSLGAFSSRAASIGVSMRQDTVMDEHSILRAPRFIGRVEGFLTPLPAERPKQTPLFFIFPARRLAREGGLPNWSRT
jgi:hypothetical protein